MNLLFATIFSSGSNLNISNYALFLFTVSFSVTLAKDTVSYTVKVLAAT